MKWSFCKAIAERQQSSNATHSCEVLTLRFCGCLVVPSNLLQCERRQSAQLNRRACDIGTWILRGLQQSAFMESSTPHDPSTSCGEGATPPPSRERSRVGPHRPKCRAPPRPSIHHGLQSVRSQRQTLEEWEGTCPESPTHPLPEWHSELRDWRTELLNCDSDGCHAVLVSTT